MTLNDEAEMMEWNIQISEAGARLDKYVSESMEDEASRSQVQLWIDQQCILVNNKAVKPNYKVKEDDHVVLHIPLPKVVEITPENIPLEIVFEDSHVIVVNKPRGMVVHPALGHSTGTLVNALMYHCKDLSGINGEIRPGVVHRIDKDTSGLLMVAKNDRAHASLAAQLKDHSVTRKYIAVVHGVLSHQLGTIDAPIGRDAKDRKLYIVKGNNSKQAVTHFTVMETFKDCTLLELKLETGRTHQIRVHMKFIDHPLVGDPAYGRNKGISMKGQALHAAALGFIHPVSNEYLEFSANLPADMNHLLDMLRSQ